MKSMPLLVFVEGFYDVSFLLRIAEVLHVRDPVLPDLADCEESGKLVFVPVGGDLQRWASRFAPLHLPEFHLYDREVEPLTSERESFVGKIMARRGCVAQLTRKRSIENYLHSDAVFEATCLRIEIDDTSDVQELLARQNAMDKGEPAWEDVPRRSRRKLRDRAKQLLNTLAVERMTVERLAERDPAGEVIGWLQTIRRLIEML